MSETQENNTSLEKLLEAFENCRAIQEDCVPMVGDTPDPYMEGYYNGIALGIAILSGKDIETFCMRKNGKKK